VLDVLCSLCVGNGVAVRTNQNLICDNLLPGCDLLLQTKLINHVSSMKPNVYVGILNGSSMYKRWYFEVMLDHLEVVSHLPPVLRVGWANTYGFVPHPGGGEKWGANGAGDNLYSYAFDGQSLWTGGRPKQVKGESQTFKQGDVVGCSLDLAVPQITFSVNGIRVPGIFKDFNINGLFFPVISMSASTSCRFLLGGEHGRLKYGPPDNHSPVVECLLPKEKVKVEPCFMFGDVSRNIICGPTEICEYTPFVPNPVDTAN
ncbi:ryanodine receptor-like, partial [Mizuhopecten yessoensis]